MTNIKRLNDYTKLVSKEIYLDRHIEDENIVIMTKHYPENMIIIFDRTEINDRENLINYDRLSCIKIKETFRDTFDKFCYSYLYNEENVLDFNKYITEPLRELKHIKYTFSDQKKLIMKLRKTNDLYYIDYYYNNNALNKFIQNKKDLVLNNLFQYVEYTKVSSECNQKLNKIITNVDKYIELENVEIEDVYQDITLYDYQINDIKWIQSIEKKVIQNENEITYTLCPYYTILNDKYIITPKSEVLLNTGDNGLSRSKKSTFIYKGGHIISDMGLGKSLIMLYIIITDKKEHLTFSNNIFKKFGENCNYFYKAGELKGLCCKTKCVTDKMYCKKHLKSMIFIDKREIILQNMDCFNIKFFYNPIETYYSLNKECNIPLLNTNSTLILCPSHLCDQWIKEYYDKVKTHIKKDLHVLTITTFNQYQNLTIADILFSDIVIMGYNFLTNPRYMNTYKLELNQLNQEHPHYINSKNFGFHYFHWNRIIFDEYHEINKNEGSYCNLTSYHSNVLFNELIQLKSTYKWNVSGTPFSNGINGFINGLQLISNINDTNDFYDTFKYDSYINYTHILYTGLNMNLIENSEILFKRNTKESVKFNIKLIENVKMLTFTNEEKTIYNAFLEGSKNKYSKFLVQLCCHPDLNSETRNMLKKCQTLNQIQDELLKHYTVKMNYHNKQIILLTSNIQNIVQEAPLIESNTQLTDQLSILRRNLTNNKKLYENYERTINYIKIAIEEVNKNKEETCPICLDIIHDIVITQCGHKFCTECIQQYIKTNTHIKCPCCNIYISKNEIYKIHLNNDINLENKSELDQIIYNVKSTKIGNILYHIKNIFNTPYTSTTSLEKEAHTPLEHTKGNIKNKIIIFSQWDEILDKVYEYLNEYNIKTVCCKGTVFEKKRSIDLFKQSLDCNIILLSSRHAASGINLTNANHIIFIEPIYGSKEYRKNIENQAIARCERLGCNHDITVTRFIINDTIESDIYHNKIDDNLLTNYF